MCSAWMLQPGVGGVPGSEFSGSESDQRAAVGAGVSGLLRQSERLYCS